ncbi:DNA polymerase III subunits gamma and tau [Vibrio maritimus]|uniref:DNA polymerase III subunit gamma/tau n=1 Tax=Vibrio maritimus TaxID=990268 RepID=A0A090SLD7_9VIBR|nr:DNA polymerase III subunits gamma and tau [Vibrio maritimus]
MSYLALARKWRPKKFSEVVGQAHVLTALENALDQNRLHHAYLFSGTRGVGKTTIGRLFAKGLNCETGITATPCGQCSTCKEIDEGRSVDLLEIDAASRTKVEDTRELLDNVQYKPARSRFKVYLIDEVHMLSRHSFNALLKTLEEPPEYVKFLLATTDPQKLPMTILSRCLQFHLKPITVDNIQQQLEHVLTEEQVSQERRALALLAHAADGSMRDALSLTDQAIALGSGNVSTDIVSQMLGTLDTAQALQLLEAISTGDAEQVMARLNSLADNGVDWDVLLSELATQLHRIALAQALPTSVDNAVADGDKIRHLAGALQATDVQLYYQITLKGRQDLPFSPSQRVAVEMTLLRMLAFRPVSQVAASEINAAPSQPQMAPVAQTAPAPTAPVQTAPSQTMSTQPMAHTQSAPQYAGSIPQYEDGPEPYIDTSQMPPPAPMQGTPQRAPQPQMQPDVNAAAPSQPVAPAAPQESAPARAAGGLRHQLRSRRQSAGQNTQPSGTNPGKKPKASSEPSSVLERVAMRTQGRGVSPTSVSDVAETKTEQANANEPYQWRPSSNAAQQQSKPTIKPSTLKKALEHEKTPEMAQRLTTEAAAQDAWADMIEKLDIGKLVQQLALNSVYQKDGTSIQLGLRPTHAHLNSDKNQSELLAGLNVLLGEECHLSIEVSEQGTTPLELRENLYQMKLTEAAQSLQTDPNVQFMLTRFAAQLDEESIRPL